VTVVFISDTHFGHERILDFCRGTRLGSSIGEHDELLVETWNRVVSPGTTVYHLGDFAWRGGLSVFGRLNGKKHLVAGNHDYHDTRKLPWESVQYALRLKIAGVMLYASHYPVVGCRENVSLHGHAHGKETGILRAIDVGADVYREMLPLDVLLGIMKARGWDERYGRSRS